MVLYTNGHPPRKYYRARYLLRGGSEGFSRRHLGNDQSEIGDLPGFCPALDSVDCLIYQDGMGITATAARSTSARPWHTLDRITPDQRVDSRVGHRVHFQSAPLRSGLIIRSSVPNGSRTGHDRMGSSVSSSDGDAPSRPASTKARRKLSASAGISIRKVTSTFRGLPDLPLSRVSQPEPIDQPLVPSPWT